MPFEKGKSGNPATQFSSENQPEKQGRPKGRRNLATIIRDMLESEDFNWDLLPLKNKDFAKKFNTPWEAIVATAVAQSLSGNTKAQTWLSKSGYGSQIDVTTKGESINPYTKLSEEELRKLANK